MSRISQQVQNQITASDKVASSAETHAAKIGAALAERLPDPPAPAVRLSAEQWKTVVLQLGGHVLGQAGELKVQELTYTAEQADDPPVREARDAKVTEVVALMTRLRSTVEDTLGRSALKAYGLTGETPRVPRKLLGHVENVAQLLEKKPATAATPFGASFDTAVAASSLRTQHAALTALLQAEDREARELEDALTRRDRSAAAWTEGYQGVAGALEGLYRMAGWIELADRVRPTQRTLRGEDAGAEDDNGEEGSGDASGGEPPV